MKKRTIRVLSMILTLVMFLSVSTPAFAVGGGEIGEGWDRDIGEDEIRQPDFDPDLEFEEDYDYFQALDEETMAEVTVEAPMGSLPTLAEVRLEPIPAEDLREAVDEIVEGSPEILVAMDISFWLGEDEIEPEEPVRVKISSPELQGKSNLQVIHFPDDAEEPETVQLIPEDDLTFTLGTNEVAFMADSFSVYAVVGEGEVDDNARLIITFKQANDGEDIVIPVKKSDLGENYEMVLYDPGVGNLTGRQSFFGWTTDQNYTNKTKGSTIAQIRTDVQTMLNAGVAEGTKLTYYPMIFDLYRVSFLDEDGAGIKTDPVLVKAGASETYTIDEDYDPKNTDARFEGWGVASKNDEEKWVLPANEDDMTLYKNGTTLTFGTGTGALTDDLVLRAYVPAGYWLIFKENGTGASFTPPEFYRGAVTVEPDDPTRFGYEFDGWYLASGYTDEEETQPIKDEQGNVILGAAFEFGHVLEKTTRLYAKWKTAATASYTVIIWNENINCDGYDFKDIVTVENVALPANTNVVARDQDSSTGYYKSIRINNSSTSAMNKSYEGFHVSDKEGYTITNVAVTPECTTVVNVYFDRDEYTFTFRDYAYTVATDHDNNPEKYGVVDGKMARVYWNYGAFRTTNSWYGDEYSGTVYTRSNSQTTIHTVTKKYKQDISGIWEFTLDNGISYPQGNTSWTPSGSSTYLARITAAAVMPAENITFTHTTSDNDTRYFHYYVEVPSGETGTRTFQGRQFNLYKDLPNDFNVVYYNDDYWDLRGFDRLAIAKSNDDVVNLSANGTISWANLNYYYGGDNNHLYFYYTRQQYKINYMDGRYYNGDGVWQSEETPHGSWGQSPWIDFDASIASYGKGGENYLAPTDPNGKYVFAGWYADAACNTPYTFDKMPLPGVTVYAKWIIKQYRVFLHPNATNTLPNGTVVNDTTFQHGEQNTCFRIDYDEEISKPKYMRAEYDLAGFYTDPSLKSQYAFSFDSFTANDTTVTTTYSQDPETESTERDYYGDVTKYENSDAQKGRFWITRKIELYAKWRFKLIGADGITVVYESGEEGKFADNTTTHTDPMRYEDTAEAVAQAAANANAPAEGQPVKEFKCWVLQEWNGTAFVPTSTKVNPGDLFDISASQAQIVDNETNQPVAQGATLDKNKSYTYTIKLVAEYGEIEAPTPTHIDWYPNNGSTGTVYEQEDVMINDPQKIPMPAADYPNSLKQDKYMAWPAANGVLEYQDHVFLGWARVDTADKDAVLSGEIQLGEDDLFLKYVPENGTFLAQIPGSQVNPNIISAPLTAEDPDTEEWNVVDAVACDENNPYHDMIAVWGKVFYIYHTSDNTVERIVIPESQVSSSTTEGEGGAEPTQTTSHDPITVDLASRTKPDCLYGGYYKAYNGVGLSTESGKFDVNSNQLTWLTASSDEIVPEGAASLNHFAENGWLSTTTDKNAKPYDGGVEVAFLAEQAYSAKAGDADGMHVNPVAGTVYYIKEVPAATYLQPYLHYSYKIVNEGDNLISSIWLVSDVDDALYKEIGFVIDGELFPAEGRLTADGIDDYAWIGRGCKSLKITVKDVGNGEAERTLKPNELFGAKDGGYLTYRKVKASLSDTCPIEEKSKVYQYWVTLDGVLVTGTDGRCYQNVTTTNIYYTPVDPTPAANCNVMVDYSDGNSAH